MCRQILLFIVIVNCTISVTDTVVTETEKFSHVDGMKRDGTEVTLGGNAFHTRAPATRNAWSSSEDRRVAGTTTTVLETWWTLSAPT